MESWLPWVIQLLSGAAGGVGAGQVLKNQSLGTVGNAISGVVGGGLGGIILNVLTGIQSSGALTAGNIGADIAGGGVGGAVVMILVSVIKKALGK
ncbi:MAG: hypothetical protein JW807_06985 [Spirochaetes bacterium]|nr:hypothetical protein [Spirochaetota bacterium]